ncbi:MAG: YciI family protein [Gemmatimonadota bacterium]|nr:YciI family protein [Gemmatimonadota bacterium]
MTLVKSAENFGPPPKELMEAMAKLGEESARAGILVETGGLAPSAAATRVRISKRRVTVVDGPFTEAKEVVGGYAVLEVKSKEQAVEETRRFMDLHAKYWPSWEGETEIRQIFSPDDFAPGGNHP